ncbi:MAG: BTAD domain-containing putative transcriptional regulator [Gemmatimonadaceae bacterium]
MTFERDGSALSGAAAQRRLLAVAIMIASAGDRGVSRERVLATLWTDADPERARQALSQTLYHMRRALNADEPFASGADLRFNSFVVRSDVAEFETAVEQGDLEAVATLHRGPFLDGFHVSGAPEFERWASMQRARLAERCAEALEQLAQDMERGGDYRRAVEWRRQLAAHEPLNGRAAAGFIAALAAAGDRASALQFARVHEALVRDELDTEPDSAVVQLVERLRDDPGWSPVPAASGQPSDESAEPAPTPGVAAGKAVASPAPSADSHVRRQAESRSYWRLISLALALVLLIVAAYSGLSRFGEEPAVPLQADLIAVAPFRVSGADPTLGYLREGMVDLLVVKLTEVGAARAAEPALVLGAWRRAIEGDDELPLEQSLSIARRLGAGQLLLGNVVGTPAKVVVSATLHSVTDGVVRGQATAEGPSDSLTMLVDRLTGQLLAGQAGERERLASHTTSSLVALRSYLSAQAAYRGGDYHEAVGLFTRAVESDSGFAMAGLGLALAADRVDGSADRARGIELAWRARAELTDRDRALLDAMAGSQYPDSSSLAEQLASWEHAAAVAPDRPEVWHELGERLFTDGRAVGVKSSEERAIAAFRRARELDPTFLPPLMYLALLEARAGNRTKMREHVSAYVRSAPGSAISDFLRWRLAVAMGDDGTLARLRERYDSLNVTTLRWIALSSQHDGIAVDDGTRALELLRTRAARLAHRREAVLGLHSLALLRGRPDEALALTGELDDGQPGSRSAERIRVLDALYGSGDNAAARAAMGRLMPGASSHAPTPDDACVIGQWGAWHGETRTARMGLRVLRDSPQAAGTAVACSALVEAVTAVQRGLPEARRLVERSDSIVAVGPPLGDTRAYASLAIARMYASLGDPERALASVRRRPYLRGWPRYLGAYLREEGRLAAATGDREGAANAYRQYLALRNSAAPSLVEEADSVRAELGALGWRWRGD